MRCVAGARTTSVLRAVPRNTAWKTRESFPHGKLNRGNWNRQLGRVRNQVSLQRCELVIRLWIHISLSIISENVGLLVMVLNTVDLISVSWWYIFRKVVKVEIVSLFSRSNEIVIWPWRKDNIYFLKQISCDHWCILHSLMMDEMRTAPWDDWLSFWGVGVGYDD